MFLALGINKQLDLQSALTEVGRIVVAALGWLQQKQLIQVGFIILVAIVCVIAVMVLLSWARSAPIPTWFGLIGVTLVIGFVMIRAASFHHIDRFIGTTFVDLNWNWILEMGGISVVLLASLWRRRSQPLDRRGNGEQGHEGQDWA